MDSTRIAEKLAKLGAEQRKLVGRMLAGSKHKQGDRAPTFEEEALRIFHAPEHRTKAGTKKFYNTINQQLDRTIFGECSSFLNYGYVEDGAPQMSNVELPSQTLSRSSVKLVLELIGDCDLAGKRVLDVGCGRGGTLSVVNQFFRAESKVGLDLSSAAIAHCRKIHRFPDTSFQVGDAEQLPFPSGEFDVVLNLESSHSYLDMSAFYSGVKRVLAPGGYFLYADMFVVERFEEHRNRLLELGFVIEQNRDITHNVLLSCRETARLRSRAFADAEEQSVIEDFLSTPGSSVFQQMETGRAVYRILKIKRS